MATSKGKGGRKGGELGHWIGSIMGGRRKRWGSSETQATVTVPTITAPSGGTAGTVGTEDLKPLPLIGRLPLRRQYAIALGGLVGSIALSLLLVGLYYRDLGAVTAISARLQDTQVGAQRLAKSAQRALLGDARGFDELSSAREKFDADFGKIRAEDAGLGNRARMAELNAAAAKSWEAFGSQISDVIDKREQLMSLAANAKRVADDSTKLLDKTEQLAAVMQQTGAAPAEEAYVNYALLLSQRVSKTASSLLLSESISPESIFLVRQDSKTMGSIFEGLAKGDPKLGVRPLRNKYAAEQLKEVARFYVEFSARSNALADDVGKVARTKEAGARAGGLADAMNKSLGELSAEVESAKSAADVKALFAALLGLLSLLSLGLAVAINSKETKRQAHFSRREQAGTQQAIMRLLDEMADLADGDLTVRATVSEEITGAIADSVNFAIGQLSELVQQIQLASSQMEEATGRASGISARLLQIHMQQTRDINAAGAAVISIVADIEEVAKRMEESSEVAERSVEASEKGILAVEESARGMESIASNVDETAKRVRRLSESSEEISQIVDLIAEIAEQTSVLAINATVQATKAGAAGKGFKVVADAVQELANRASEATRRIGALISQTQTDIQAASSAIEETAGQTVAGQAQAATTREALAEIAKVSETLSLAVTQINARVSTSAKGAGEVTETVQRLLESVNESVSSTRGTSEAIEEINKLSERLRDSVAGFRVH